MKITVVAVFPNGGFGFNGQRRLRDGDVFSIDEDKFSPGWMERVDDDAGDVSEPEEAEVVAPVVADVAKPKVAQKAKAVRTGVFKRAKKAGK